MQAAAKAANWQARPSPRQPTEPEPEPRNRVSGRGIACVLYEGDNGYCAMVAEVDVHLDTGVVDVKRLVMALDSGPISNPDGLRNQAEGGALHGMSRALFEEVTWDDEKVTSVDWRTYRTFPVGFKIPEARDRAHQLDGRGSVRSRGDVDHRHGRGDRQRDLRRDR